MCGKLVVLVLSAGLLFAAATYRQTTPNTFADVVRDEPSAIVRHVIAAARTFSGDQCGQPTNANPGGDAIPNPASELSLRTSYARKSTAKGGGFIPASVANVAPGFCTTSDLVAFRPFGGGELRNALSELRRSEAVDARNFFAASANCLERNRLRGALGGTIKPDECDIKNSGSGMIGRFVSGWILAGVSRMGGLHGWQRLYLLPGAPAVPAGICFMSLPKDDPGQVSWLTVLEKRLLRARLAEKQTGVPEGRRLSTVLDLSRSSGQIGLLGAIPWTSGLIAMPAIPRYPDATTERRWHIVFAGVAGSAFAAFWRLPTAILSSTRPRRLGSRGLTQWATSVAMSAVFRLGDARFQA